MDTLPPELLNEISENIPQERGVRAKLAGYSSISLAWKAAIERLTFKTLSIRIPDDLDALSECFSGVNVSRRTALTSLIVKPILPRPGNPKGCCLITRPLDREADSVAFSKTMVKLFTALKLEGPIAGQSALSLSIWEVYRRSPVPGYEKGKATMPMPCKKWKHSERVQSKAIATSGEFELLYCDLIPKLHGVTTLDFGGGYDMYALKPTWIPGIVGKLPDLEKLVMRKADSCEQSLDRRTAQRNSMYIWLRTLR
jgi:hypothetical protein